MMRPRLFARTKNLYSLVFSCFKLPLPETAMTCQIEPGSQVPPMVVQRRNPQILTVLSAINCTKITLNKFHDQELNGIFADFGRDHHSSWSIIDKYPADDEETHKFTQQIVIFKSLGFLIAHLYGLPEWKSLG